MDIFASIKAAASGLRAQSGRMRVIAENIANANSTGQTPGADPYRRQIPVFKTELDRATGVTTVNMDRVTIDRSDFTTRFQPGHPAADENGMVKIPNVTTLVESMDMREAQRSYEANLNVISATRRMVLRTLDILRA
ncbi:MAG: flagellar basal body rod protein FlgC [Pseudomonadota bacterium]